MIARAQRLGAAVGSRRVALPTHVSTPAMRDVRGNHRESTQTTDVLVRHYYSVRARLERKAEGIRE